MTYSTISLRYRSLTRSLRHHLAQQGTRVFFFQRGILKVLQTKSQQSSDMHCALWPNVDESVWRIQRYMHTCYIHVVYTILCVCLYIKRAFWRCKTVQEDCRMLGQSVKLVQKQKYTEHWTDITWIGTQVTSPILWWFNTGLLEKCVRKEQKQKSRDANGIIIYIKCGKYTLCMITQLVAIPATQWLDWLIWCRHVHWCISEQNGVTSAKRLAVFRHVAQTGPQLKSAQTDLSMLRMG